MDDYDEIFKVFEAVKSHCHENGNKTFEESAVFELCENFYRTHGSDEAIAIITDLLDVRNLKDFSNDSNKSNDDADSIIEIEVQPKIYPVVDLTGNSPQSDDAVIIEDPTKPKFKSERISDHGLGTPEILNTFEDQLSNFFDNSSDHNDSILNVMFEVNIDNSRIPEERDITEMFEENNNDPNNNLDGLLLDEEPVSSNNNVLISESTEPAPGCSKDMEIWKNNDNNSQQTIVCQSNSPIPGCSKDTDNLINFESSLYFEDESIQKDAICIQEIIPWANLDTIRTILKKHGDSPNRKQLTLWDLMSEVSSQTNANIVKRKQNDDLCKIPKKSPKTEDIDESSLDLSSHLQSTNTVCNESSNDSRSSKMSEGNESTSETIDKNKKEQLPDTTESSKTFLNEQSLNNSSTTFDFPEKFINNANNCNIIDEAANLISDKTIKNPYFKQTNIDVPISNYKCSLTATGHLLKKERNETIVSGSYCNRSQSINDLENVNVINGNSEVHKKNEKDKIIKIELEKNINSFFQNKTYLEGSPPGASNSLPSIGELIKPSKLKIQEKPPVQILAKPTTTTIRPSTFSYAKHVNISYTNHQKIDVRKDLNNPSQRQTVNIKPATVTQPNQLVDKPIQLMLPQYSKDRLMVKSGLFSAAIENPFSPKSKKEHGLSTKPISAAGTRPVLFQEAYRPPPLVTQQQLKPTSSSKIKSVQSTSASNIGTILTIGASSLPKVQPTATITSYSLPKQILNQPSTSAAQKILPSQLVEVPDHQIYNKLRSIFPNVKKSYMKKICINPPGGANYNNKEQIIDILIDHLLKEGNNHLRRIDLNLEEERIISPLSVDGKYEYLLGIFPDADPTYLRDFIEKHCTTEKMLEEFIQQKLEKRNYPTKEQYLAKIKITEQIKQYTTDFKVEKFLELFPDPFKHFEDASRKCEYQPIAAEFLKAFFNKNKVNTISRYYSVNCYNLSLTAKALSELGHDMKSKRMTFEMPTEDIPLLQEMAFVKNKKNIQQYIHTLKTQEEELFKDYKEKNLLLTCQCCFNDEIMPTKSSECNSGHDFCFDCIIRGTESKLADGEAHVKCFTNCDSEFPLAILQKVLPPTTFSALLKKRQAAEIMAAGMDDLVSCPFCHFASIPPPEDKVFKCLNPECMKETCRQCKELNHIPLRCDEVVKNNKADKARRLIEEKMTQALLRTCYKCKKQFYKDGGCNKMLCNCGALMCYLCDKPVKGYDHFNPQGGTNMHLCPLWSDDNRLNAESVRKVAQDMQKAMQQDNPDLEIDMASLLPKLPPRIKGAHDDIPNANELPEHVRRIAAPRENLV